MADGNGQCPRCTRALGRTHRSALEKLLFSDAWHCATCHVRVRRLYPRLEVRLRFYFSRHTCCIRCGNTRIQRLSCRDRLDAMTLSVTSQFLRLTGAPLNKCNLCRLQYHDWRPIQPRIESV